MKKFILKLLGNIAESVFGAGIGSLFRRAENASLTGKEREQNEFNASQAELQRQFASSEREASQTFNAEQAQKQMDFQEYMASTQYQRSVADMQAAGVNPAVTMTGGIAGASAAGAMASSSPASGAAASGTSSPVGLSDIMQAARFKKDLELADAEIENRKSDANYKNAAAGLTGAQEQLTRKEIVAFDPMNKATLDNLLSNLKTKEVERRLAEQHISQSEAETQLTLNNAFLSAIDIKYRDELNTLNMRLRISELGLNQARQNKIGAEINELYQRAIYEAAMAGNLDQQTRNLAIQEGILQYDEQEKKFTVDHLKADRNWRIAGQVVSSIVGIGSAAAGLATGAGILGNAAVGAANASINNSRLQWQMQMAQPAYRAPMGFGN